MTPIPRPTVGSLLLAALFIAAGPSAAAASAAHFDVRHFGARCDGSTDDTASIRKAADAAGNTGGDLDFPEGRCVIHATIYIRSHVHVIGQRSTLLAALPWNAPHEHAYALLENEHYDEGNTADTDLVVQGMTFDFGDLGPVAMAGGGKHALRFQFARNIRVEGNVFQVRGGEDAVAGVGVQGMTVSNNQAYDFRNCAYDFWSSPADVSLNSNRAETTTSAQMVNFNPERTSGNSSGLTAHSFHMTRNTLIATGDRAVPIQLEPLGAGTTVTDIHVTDNTLQNVFLVLRGGVSHAEIRDNVIRHVLGGYPAIETYPHFGATAENLTIAGNRIEDVETASTELGIVRIEAGSVQVDGNAIIGSRHAVPDYYRGPPRP